MLWLTHTSLGFWWVTLNHYISQVVSAHHKPLHQVIFWMITNLSLHDKWFQFTTNIQQKLWGYTCLFTWLTSSFHSCTYNFNFFFRLIYPLYKHRTNIIFVSIIKTTLSKRIFKLFRDLILYASQKHMVPLIYLSFLPSSFFASAFFHPFRCWITERGGESVIA
jgi:hypothetical protein